jgi:hypothetical protein
MQAWRARSASVAGAPCLHHHAARRQSFIRQGAEADRQIETVFDQVDRAVGHLHLHLDLRVAPRELGDDRRDSRAAETERGVQAQQALGRSAAADDRILHLTDTGQDSRRVREVGFALIGQADAARGAVDQAHAQARFQLRQALCGGRRGQVERARSRSQRAVTRDQHEEIHLGGCVPLGLGTIHCELIIK